ncbi:hypothetical protein JCM31271_09250 [Halorubrum trueperi]
MNSLLDWYSDDSVSAIHHALRSSRRRLCIVIVAEHVSESFAQQPSDRDQYDKQNSADGDLTVREIAREITAIEQEVPTDRATGEPYHNVYTSLIQSHLPRLDAIDAVSYDSDRKIVRPAQNLFPLLIAVSTTSPIHMVFHTSAADLYAGGLTSQSPIDDYPST